MRSSASWYKGTNNHARFRSFHCHLAAMRARPRELTRGHQWSLGPSSRQEHTTPCVWYSRTCPPTPAPFARALALHAAGARQRPLITSCPHAFSCCASTAALPSVLTLVHTARSGLDTPRAASSLPRMPLPRSHVPRMRLQPRRLASFRMQRRTPPRDSTLIVSACQAPGSSPIRSLCRHVTPHASPRCRSLRVLGPHLVDPELV